jgi:predicted Zn-dependent peptidase
MRSVYAAAIMRGVVLFSWLTPPLATPGDLDLDVLAQILTSRGGRLERALVQTGLATRVFSREVSFARASEFVIQVIVADHTSPDAVAAALDREIDAVRSSLSPAEVELAKRRLRERELAQFERAGPRAIRLAAEPRVGALETRDHDGCDVESVVDTARTYLTPQNGVSALVRPATNAPVHGMTLWRERVSP